MEPAGCSPPRDHRRLCWHLRGAPVPLEIKPAAPAVPAIAGEGYERFLVTEEQTAQIGHGPLPDEPSHSRRQPGCREPFGHRQWSWFWNKTGVYVISPERSPATPQWTLPRSF